MFSSAEIEENQVSEPFTDFSTQYEVAVFIHIKL